MRPLDLIRDAGNMAEYARGFFPPDFGEWRHYGAELIVTLQIALTALARALLGAAVPAGRQQPHALCGCISPCAVCSTPAAPSTRSSSRCFFVVAVGLGPLPACWRCGAHHGHPVQALLRAVETIDPSPSRVSAPPAPTRMAEIVFGVLPRSLPLWISHGLYRFESKCARHPSSAWSARAASAWCCGT